VRLGSKSSKINVSSTSVPMLSIDVANTLPHLSRSYRSNFDRKASPLVHATSKCDSSTSILYLAIYILRLKSLFLPAAYAHIASDLIFKKPKFSFIGEDQLLQSFWLLFKNLFKSPCKGWSLSRLFLVQQGFLDRNVTI
jgi:hypothetical protein